MNRSIPQVLLTISILLIGSLLEAQNITLEECYQAAESLSPLEQQKLYHESIAELKVSSAKNMNRPRVMLNGQASYQSDVFSLPFSFPNQDTPSIPKDQYRLSLSLQQTIYNGGLSQRSMDLAETEVLVNKQQVAVKLYQVREVINNLYFGALIAQENQIILDSLRSTLIVQLEQVASRVKNGVLLSSNEKVLRKEVLSLEQQLIIVQQDKLAALRMLQAWTGRNIESSVSLAVPPMTPYSSDVLNINRPEMQLFDLKSQQIGAVQSLTAKNNAPHISAFVDGGLGQPNPFNFFETDVSAFYMAGVKLQWNLMDWGTNKNDLKVFDLQKEIVNTEKRDFEKRINISMSKERSDIQKYQALIQKDQEILSLQQSIVKESFAQLKNGLITSTQYMMEVNNETRAKLNIKIHELSLIHAQVNLLVKSGNL